MRKSVRNSRFCVAKIVDVGDDATSTSLGGSLGRRATGAAPTKRSPIVDDRGSWATPDRAASWSCDASWRTSAGAGCVPDWATGVPAAMRLKEIEVSPFGWRRSGTRRRAG